MEELLIIQSKLKAPKSQLNKFGGYNYRNCEDILEALKPLLFETKCTLTITDEVIMIGSRIYIKATATLTNSDGKQEIVSALAREEEVKKGMDSSQITGAASSYARKYALNGLFCIDDTKDPDTTNTHGKEENTQSSKKHITPSYDDKTLLVALDEIGRTQNRTDLNDIWKHYPMLQGVSEFVQAVKAQSTTFQPTK